MLAKFTELKNINVMSKEKVELRKEVFMFMEKQGHELKLSLDGSPIPYGIVNHLIASFYEHKMEELSKFSQHDVSGSVCPHLQNCINKGKNEYCSLEVFKSIDCFMGQNEH